LIYSKNIKAENQFVPSPFQIACRSGNDRIILLLLDYLDAESLVETFKDETPIHLLLENRGEEKVETTRAILEKIRQGKKYLLDNMILNTFTPKNCSVLQTAMENEHVNIVDMILQDYYPKDFCPDKNGNNPIHLAACSGSVDVLNVLVGSHLFCFFFNFNLLKQGNF
jgi:ankyrin repeat protein